MATIDMSGCPCCGDVACPELSPLDGNITGFGSCPDINFQLAYCPGEPTSIWHGNIEFDAECCGENPELTTCIRFSLTCNDPDFDPRWSLGCCISTVQGDPLNCAGCEETPGDPCSQQNVAECGATLEASSFNPVALLFTLTLADCELVISITE